MRRFLTTLTAATLTAGAVPLLATGSPAAAATSSTDATLEIALEIHVENSANPTTELATVADLARAANRYDIDLTFSLDEGMVAYLATAPAAVKRQLARWEANGHQFGLHADLAKMTETTARLHLVEIVDDYEDAFLHLPTTLSGACTASGDWVDAAADLGLTTIAGTVTYCERTLDPAIYAGTIFEPEVAAAASCVTPVACHDPAPQADAALRLLPWRTSSAATWLTAEADGAVTIAPTLGSTSMECVAEGRSGRCAFDAATDAAGFVALAAEADALSEQNAGATLHMAWSTNNRPTRSYIEDLFRAIAADLGDAGATDWVTLSQAGA